MNLRALYGLIAACKKLTPFYNSAPTSSSG
jgi:hypothetical protein